MKKQQGFFALALPGIAVVGMTVAVASSFAPVPGPIPSPVTSTPPAPSGPAVAHAAIEIRQAPVPLVMKPRPPLEQPTFDADAVGPAVVPALSATAGDRAGDGAATGLIKVGGLMANLKDAPGVGGPHAPSGQPTAAGTRWAP